MTAIADSMREPGRGRDGSRSRLFRSAVAEVRKLKYRPELTVTETPGPARLAPHSFALDGAVELEGVPVGSARLVILHDPVAQAGWGGTSRVIAFVDADVDLEVAADPLLPGVGWSWLVEALDSSGAVADCLGGTVTQVGSTSFGVMSDRQPEGRLQVRASWTPRQLRDLPSHAVAWATLISLACGLPLDTDVAALRP